MPNQGQGAGNPMLSGPIGGPQQGTYPPNNMVPNRQYGNPNQPIVQNRNPYPGQGQDSSYQPQQFNPNVGQQPVPNQTFGQNPAQIGQGSGEKDTKPSMAFLDRLQGLIAESSTTNNSGQKVDPKKAEQVEKSPLLTNIYFSLIEPCLWFLWRTRMSMSRFGPGLLLKASLTGLVSMQLL